MDLDGKRHLDFDEIGPLRLSNQTSEDILMRSYSLQSQAQNQTKFSHLQQRISDNSADPDMFPVSKSVIMRDGSFGVPQQKKGSSKVFEYQEYQQNLGKIRITGFSNGSNTILNEQEGSTTLPFKPCALKYDDSMIRTEDPTNEKENRQVANFMPKINIDFSFATSGGNDGLNTKASSQHQLRD